VPPHVHCAGDLEEFADAYLLGRLTEGAAATFEEHLLGCPNCLGAVEEADAFMRAIRGAASAACREAQPGGPG
jgi:hypothetical protein